MIPHGWRQKLEGDHRRYATSVMSCPTKSTRANDASDGLDWICRIRHGLLRIDVHHNFDLFLQSIVHISHQSKHQSFIDDGLTIGAYVLDLCVEGREGRQRKRRTIFWMRRVTSMMAGDVSLVQDDAGADDECRTCLPASLYLHLLNARK